MEVLVDYLPFITAVCLYSLVGCTGNILIMIVYWRERVQLSHTLFIKTLCVIDLTVCSVIMPYSIAFELHLIRVDFICRLVELVRHLLVVYSNFILIAIAVERYFAVCKPMKKLRYEQLRLTLLVGFVISILLTFPVATIFRVCKSEECLEQPINGNGSNVAGARNETFSQESKVAGSPLTGSDATTTHKTNTQQMHEEPFCQFTTTILGQVGASVYQGFLLLVFCVAVLIFTVVYPMVYRVVLSRSHWRRNRVGVMRSEDLSQNLSNSNKILVHTLTSGDPGLLISNKSKNITEDSSALPVFTSGKQFQAMPSQSTSINKNDHRSKKLKSSRTGTMLFVCTAIFVVTWMAFWIDVFTPIENLTFRHLFLLSHVTNPIVYGIMSKEVRSEVLGLFSCRYSNN